MRLSSYIIKISLVFFVLVSASILAYAAATITNPLCSLEQVTDYPMTGFYMTSISGDGNRAVVGSSPEGEFTDIYNLSTNTLIASLDNAGYPVMDYDGSRIAFYSNNNLTGQNADGSYELFLWDNGTTTQLTSLTGLNTVITPPDISDDGSTIVFGVDTNGTPFDFNYQTKYYVWREGTGVESLFDGASQPATGTWSYTPIRLSADGSSAVFLNENQLTGSAPADGGVYRINLATEAITFLFARDNTEYPFEFMFIDGDGSRVAFNSIQNYSGLNPDGDLNIWLWDSSAGFRILDNGATMPTFPYTFPMGFSADGNRLLFSTAFNPTGENPDGSFEYYIYEYSSDTIRQISSRTGFPNPNPANDALSADGESAAIILPSGIDYAIDDPDFINDAELFEADCDGSAGALSAPSNLRTGFATQTNIYVLWDDNSSDETYFYLERSANGGTSWTQIATFGANLKNYSNTGLTCNTSYQYRVRAYRSSDAQYSAYSNILEVSTTACPVAPTAPSNLRSTSTTQTSIALAWDDNASDETNYRLERSTNGGTGWTEIVSFSANTTTFTNSSLTCGTSYQYRIRALNSSGGVYSSYSNILEVSTTACPSALNAPSNLHTSSVAPTSITLAWNDNASDETNYYLERSTNGGTSWTQIASLSANITAYTNSSLTCNTSYQYRVRAYRSSNSQYSAYSDVLSVATSFCPPSAPSSLDKASSGQTWIWMTWNDNASDETSYHLERSSDLGTTWTEIAVIPANNTSYKDTTGLSCGISRLYRIRAYRSSDNSYSAYSATQYVSTDICFPIAQPTNLRTTSVSQTSIALAWNDNANNETNYVLQYSVNYGNSWHEIGGISANSTTYTHTGLLCNTSYWYRVQAKNLNNETQSAYSDPITGTTTACPPPPVAPSNLRTTSINYNSIALAWNDNASDETSYHLERSTNGGSTWSQFSSLGTNTTTYTSSSLSCNTSYQYRVRAYNSGGGVYSAYSNVLTVTTSACPPAPTAPSNLRTSSVTHTSIALAWNDNASDETNYRLERSTNGGTSWVQISTINPNTTIYTNTSLTCSTSYQYRVRAYRSTDGQYSAYSNTLSVTTTDCSALEAPTNLRTTSVGTTSISLAWNDNASTETNHQLERSSDGVNWTLIQTLNGTSYTDNNLVCGTIYDYRVRAYRSSDNIYSAYASLNGISSTCIPAPSNLNYVTTLTGVRLIWDDNASNETRYEVQKSGDGVNWITAASLSANSTSANINQSCGWSFYYRVYARGNNGLSAPSDTIQAYALSCSLLAPTVSTYAASKTSIHLTMSSSAANSFITSYAIELQQGNTWTEIARVNHAGTNTVHTITGLACGTSYNLRVRSYRAMDNIYSPYTSKSLYTQTCIAIPTFISAYSRLSHPLGLQVNWRDNSDNEAGFEISVRPYYDSTAEWQVVAIVSPNTTSYLVEPLQCQYTYAVRIRAFTEAPTLYSLSFSPYGQAITGTCPPLQAGSITSSANSQNSITLNWEFDDTAQWNTISYNNNGQWVELGTYPGDISTYTHTGLACGRGYQYRLITRRDNDNTTISSNPFSISTAACPPLAAPSAPLILNTSTSLVSLQIPALPAGATSMSLERSLDGLNWAHIGFANGNYLDVNVTCASSYHYRLIAYRASDGQYSPVSASVSATTPACPVAVSMIIGVYDAGNWSFVDNNSTSNPASSFSFGDASWQPLVGDWDGDGIDGIGLYRNGEFVLRSIVGGNVQESRFNFGESAGFQAVAGDWNGDGIDTIGLFGNGQFLLSDDNNSIHYRFNLGDASGWRAVAGDWDGNGADGLALYKEGIWLLVDSALNPQSQTIAYGPTQAGWLPVVGDWNGDGIDTIGLYNNGLWRIRLSSNTSGDEGSFFYGTVGNIPLSTFEGGIPGGDYSQAPFVMPVSEPEPNPEITPEATSES